MILWISTAPLHGLRCSITVDLAGHRIKKQAQPFAAPGFFERHSQAAVISCVVGDFPVPLSIPIIASLRGHHASLSRPARLSLAQGLNGQTEAGYISSSCPILLETCRPFPSITAAKNLFLYSVSCEINGYREQRSLCSGAVEIHRIKLCHARPHEEAGTAHNPKSRRGASTRICSACPHIVFDIGSKRGKRGDHERKLKKLFSEHLKKVHAA